MAEQILFLSITVAVLWCVTYLKLMAVERKIDKLLKDDPNKQESGE